MADLDSDPIAPEHTHWAGVAGVFLTISLGGLVSLLTVRLSGLQVPLPAWLIFAAFFVPGAYLIVVPFAYFTLPPRNRRYAGRYRLALLATTVMIGVAAYLTWHANTTLAPPHIMLDGANVLTEREGANTHLYANVVVTNTGGDALVGSCQFDATYGYVTEAADHENQLHVMETATNGCTPQMGMIGKDERQTIPIDGPTFSPKQMKQWVGLVYFYYFAAHVVASNSSGQYTRDICEYAQGPSEPHLCAVPLASP